MAKKPSVKPARDLRPWSLSPTCIKTFNQCLLKYWYQYIKKEKGIEDSIPLRFGVTCHSALEELGKRLHAGQPLTAELCEEIAQMVPTFAAQNQIENGDLIKEGQQFVRDRLYRHNPNYKVISTELSFYNMKLTTNKGVPLNGVVDLFLEMDPRTCIVLDYKTSRRADTIAEAKVDVQLSMYDYLISKIYPQYTHIWLVLDFLRSETVISDRTLEERRNFEEWLNGLWQKMGSMTEADVVATPNEFCAWCKFKHLCKEYESLLKEPLKLKPVMAISSDAEFAEEYRLAKILEKAASGRLDELKSWADKKVAMDGTVQFEGDNAVITWGQGSRKYYDSNALVEHIPMKDLPRLINFKNSELESFSHARPDLRPVIERAARTSPGAPRITMRKK